MKAVERTRPKGTENLRSLYAPISDEIERVEATLQAEFTSQDPLVDQMARHGFRLGGKRLRPALVLLTAKGCGNVAEEHYSIAAVMEMIHTASLLHDDVLDEATLRRHEDTVNARWNNEASILLGDYLLARAIVRMGKLNSPMAFQVIGEAARILCEGELRQVAWRGNFELSEHEYLNIIADKTAELTACCCRLGAHHAGADSRTSETLARYGRFLGIAFQIADDILDVQGDEQVTGKSLGTDLVKQKATLPLIRLLGQATGSDRKELLEILTRADNHRREALQSWYHRTDAIAYARHKAAEYAERAIGELSCLPASDACEALKSVATFSVARRE
jgi:octaprenyl-diphosphate synthase